MALTHKRLSWNASPNHFYKPLTHFHLLINPLPTMNLTNPTTIFYNFPNNNFYNHNTTNNSYNYNSTFLATSNNSSNSNNHQTDSTVSFGQVLLALILGFFVITALAGNLLVIVAILTDRNLRKAGNIFLVSLALADTFVACFVMSFAMLNDVTGRWVV